MTPFDVDPLLFVDAVKAWKTDAGNYRLDPAEVAAALPEAVFDVDGEVAVDYAVVSCVVLEAVAVLADQVAELMLWKERMTAPSKPRPSTSKVTS